MKSSRLSYYAFILAVVVAVSASFMKSKQTIALRQAGAPKIAASQPQAEPGRVPSSASDRTSAAAPPPGSEIDWADVYRWREEQKKLQQVEGIKAYAAANSVMNGQTPVEHPEKHVVRYKYEPPARIVEMTKMFREQREQALARAMQKPPGGQAPPAAANPNLRQPSSNH